MGHHFRGNHDLCRHVHVTLSSKPNPNPSPNPNPNPRHAPLPEGHPELRCAAQIEYLGEVLKGLANCMGEILSPFGALDINPTESCHAVLRRYRAKGLKWGAVKCFLGETMGFLHWQRLQLAFWGKARNPWLEFAEIVNYEFGLSVSISPREIEAMDAKLEKSVQEKEARSNPAWTSRRAAYRAHIGGYVAQAAGSSYQSGGSMAAVAADAAAAAPSALEEYLGVSDEGAGLDTDTAECEQRARDMTDPDAQDEESECEGA